MTIEWAPDQFDRRWEALVRTAEKACRQRPDNPASHFALIDGLIGARRWSEARRRLSDTELRFGASEKTLAAKARLDTSLAWPDSKDSSDQLDRAVAQARNSGDWRNVEVLCSSLELPQTGSALLFFRAITALRLGKDCDMDLARDTACFWLDLAERWTDRQAFHAALLEEIDGSEMLDTNFHRVATREAWQSETLHPAQGGALEDVFDALRQAVECHVEARSWLVPPSGLGPWTINAWAVRYPANGSQVSHIHPDAWLSAVMCVASPSASSARLLLGSLRGGPDEDLGTPWPVQAIDLLPGQMALFPSWTPHAATQTKANGERVIVSFDIVPQSGWRHAAGT